ncbi:lasso peptide biosynthesis B2 protein [Luteimonas sp. RD2P54]|uniref:Lasso peptide biosynthesis B2 protein n=1 Tax=Luteimonas endophytica TaxID=3042023 RepID=A0ABT6J7J3_9GAMM|nr:lasso peptide biosynthesis B2 protein [Luteimonas endophytica]MDH5822709.1 lasso peptide biosynthesis B2 protein [Luteimonas endophytica]
MDTATSLRLRSSLSYCLIDGHAIFLDVDGDRYFRLPAPLETTFLTHMTTGECATSALRGLLECGLLENAPSSSLRRTQTFAEPPMRSALEMASVAGFFSVGALLEVGTIVASTYWRLRTRPLRDVLDHLVARHVEDSALKDAAHGEATERRLLATAAVFNRIRPFVPVETVCLLDSIALLSFLAHRGLHASIVMGVTCDPFEAHCWVQARDLLLNETVGDACMYTPIKVIP